MSELDETESKVTAHSARASGLVKINVPVSFCFLHLSPLWSDYMAAIPKVTMDVTIAA